MLLHHINISTIININDQVKLRQIILSGPIQANPVTRRYFMCHLLIISYFILKKINENICQKNLFNLLSRLRLSCIRLILMYCTLSDYDTITHSRSL